MGALVPRLAGAGAWGFGVHWERRAGTRSAGRCRPPNNRSEAFSAANYHDTGERDLADPDQRSHNKCSKERLSTDSPPIDEELPKDKKKKGTTSHPCRQLA